MHDCVARLRLVEWLSQEGRSQAKLARLLGVSQPSVYAWIKGNSRPEPPLRAVLAEATGIPADDWETGEERSQRESGLKRVREGAA